MILNPSCGEVENSELRIPSSEIAMGLPRFGRPKGGVGESSPNLYVANCGPAVGLSFDTIASVFGAFGELKGVHAADESGVRVIVCFSEEHCAQNALKALDGRPCPDLGGRFLHIRYSVVQSNPQALFLNSYYVPFSLVELLIIEFVLFFGLGFRKGTLFVCTNAAFKRP